MADLTQLFKQTGSALERQASSSFGAKTEDFVRGAINLPGSTSTGGKREQLDPNSRKIWNSTSYAAALAGSLDTRPKLKFLFKVQFKFSDDQLRVYPELRNQDFTFMVKQADRPKVDFEYEEDVNIYNFRTKALKRIRHRPLTLVMYDDTGNRVFDFFRTLMFIYSPITGDTSAANGTKIAMSRDGNIDAWPDSKKWQNPAWNGKHRAVVNGNAGSAIECIRLMQFFVDPGKSGANKDKAVKMTYYDFVNPRLESFDFDDLSHDASDPSILTLQFDYDWMEMVKNDGVQKTPGPLYPFTPPSTLGLAAGSEAVPTDILQGNNFDTTITQGNKATDTGRNNPFLNILTQSTGRGAQELTSSLVNRATSSIVGVGGGRFANTTVGRIFSSSVSNVGTSIGGSVGGLVDGASKDILGGIGSFAKSTATRVTAPSIIADSTTSGTDTALKVVSSSTGYGPIDPAGA